MIKINLLKAIASQGAGSDSLAGMAASGSEKDQLIIEFCKRIFIIFLGVIALYLYEMYAIPELQKNLTAIQAELAETEAFNQSKSGLAAEIKKFEEEQAKINAQMNFINKITRDKINEFKLFLHLQNSTPESVWINRLDFKDDELLISAESDVSEDLNRFSLKLSNTEFLTQIIPTDQSVKVDPMGVGINTTTQNLKAKFVSESINP